MTARGIRLALDDERAWRRRRRSGRRIAGLIIVVVLAAAIIAWANWPQQHITVDCVVGFHQSGNSCVRI